MSAGLHSLRRGIGVINDQMIKVSVRSDLRAMREEKDAAQALARREKRKNNDDQESKVNYDRVVVRFNEMTTLALSYHNIAQIKNLMGLNNLVTLKLDNNTITRIENLDHLVHLTWLDLSFNNIEQITGLNALTKLTDLSLFNNCIETIEWLDKLVDLEVLSLGNNKINDLDNVRQETTVCRRMTRIFSHLLTYPFFPFFPFLFPNSFPFFSILLNPTQTYSILLNPSYSIVYS